MGFTHYWTQKRDFSAKTWAEVCEDVGAILKNVQHVQGIPLTNGAGDAGTQPEIAADAILFNGLGEDAHETFDIYRKRPPLEDWQGKGRRGWAFCKTAQKPYDLAVCAILAYLEAVHGYSVSSDGDGFEWLGAVEVAKAALPRYANQIDIPLAVRKSDRWDYRCGSVALHTDNYAVGFCIDGKTYVYGCRDESKCYCFPSHAEARAFFDKHREGSGYVSGSWGGFYPGGPLFNATGAFDKKRNAKLKRLQTKVLKALVDSAAILGRNQRPPAFVRPNAIIPEGDRATRTMAELFQLAA